MINPMIASAQVSPFYAFEQSDNFGRFIVFLLFCASILAWTIMVDKYLMLKRIRKESDSVKALFDRTTAPDFLTNLDQLAGPMMSIADTTAQGVATVLSVLPDDLGRKFAERGGAKPLGDSAVRRIRSMAESQVDEEIIEIEKRLGMLSSIVSASPFLGLLGTVWGVMMAFSGMAMEGKADIGAIAPGVSGALLTTVVGLLVAIPAVIGYNILINQVKEITVDLDNFAENLVTKIEVALGGED